MCRKHDCNDIGGQSNQPPATPIENKDVAFDESSFNLARRKFFNESVSTTSIYLARVSIDTYESYITTLFINF